jgi:hypothetical protein
MNELANIDNDPKLLQEIMEVSEQRSIGNFDNMLPIANVTIPANILITCPKARQHLSQVKNCEGCNYFNGMVQTTYDDKKELPFDFKYAVSCGYPSDRKCMSVCIEG